ncbi:hypothetical protein C4587_00850 [Candidatus Parcubacteria bacterium]|nr:MAG: hypothetical protein C4587_00850 [Candidatus Parcubacteria bacterium]
MSAYNHLHIHGDITINERHQDTCAVFEFGDASEYGGPKSIIFVDGDAVKINRVRRAVAAFRAIMNEDQSQPEAAE